MRNIFGKHLVEAGKRSARLLLLTGDHGYALFDDFRRELPGQYINAGVAEQNMIGVAAGLAKGGFFPIVYGLSAFVPIRVLEQIKIDICYEKLPVVLVGDGAGLVYSTLGNSHQCFEDVTALRAIPGISILSPADEAEMTACLQLAFATSAPVYLRMGKADLGPVHGQVPRIGWGDLCAVRTGKGALAFVATGSMVRTAIDLAERHFLESSVWSAPSLKPIDEDAVVSILRAHQAVVVLEEHSILGGLGSIISEISTTHCPSWILRVGVADRFSELCGTYRYLREEHGLQETQIVAQINSFLAARRWHAAKRDGSS